jgi:hypothetical protein
MSRSCTDTRARDRPQDAGASEQQLRTLAEVYFRDGGRRAHGLGAEFTDVEQIQFDL